MPSCDPTTDLFCQKFVARLRRTRGTPSASRLLLTENLSPGQRRSAPFTLRSKEHDSARFQRRFLSRMRKKAPLTVERKNRKGGSCVGTNSTSLILPAACGGQSSSVSRCSAYAAVVHLNISRKFVLFVSFPHGGANPVQKIPRRLIADAQRAAQLDGGNAAFVRDTQIDHPKPDRQRQMRAMHDCPSRDRGLVSTCAALEHVPPANRVLFRTAAFRADEAVRKPKPE